jgi:vacuolar-type H+-ATPase subunit H
VHEIIQKIIATENEAKIIIETARAEADRIVSDARKKATDIVERAGREARDDAEKIVEAEVLEAEQEKKQRLSDAAAEIESEVHLDRAGKQWAVEGVVRCVCGQRQPISMPLQEDK